MSHEDYILTVFPLPGVVVWEILELLFFFLAWKTLAWENETSKISRASW